MHSIKQFRIATYNIHKARGLDGRSRVARIARVLADIKPDILALQEVVSHEGRSIEDHQASYLADRFEYFHAIGETRKHRGGIYGNVTLSRWKFEQVRQVDLTVEGREERGVPRTDIRIGHTLLHVFNVHLGTAHRERRTQAIRLVDQDLLRVDARLSHPDTFCRVSPHRLACSPVTQANLPGGVAAVASRSHLLRPPPQCRPSLVSYQPAIDGRLGSSTAGSGDDNP